MPEAPSSLNVLQDVKSVQTAIGAKKRLPIVHPHLVDNEFEIINSGSSLESLEKQYQALVELKKHTQAARILNIMRIRVQQRFEELQPQINARNILITSRPEKHQGTTKYSYVFQFTSSQEFADKHLADVINLLEQPEIAGIVLADIDFNIDFLIIIQEAAALHWKPVKLEQEIVRPQVLREHAKRRWEGLPNYGVLDFPAELDIVVATGNCNLKCRMCPQASQSYKMEQLSFERFKKLIDEVPRNWTGNLSMTPYTETFLVKDIVSMIKYAKERLPNCHLGVNSNATIMSEQLAMDIIDSGLDSLHFSINTYTAEDFEWFTHGAKKFDKYEDNIRLMSAVRSRMGSKKPRLGVQLLKMPRNAPYYEAFKQRWQGVVDNVHFRGLSDWGGSVEIDGECMEGQAAPSFIKREFPCLSLWRSVVVQWDGQFIACCAAFTMEHKGTLTLGNVDTHTISEIWHGEMMNKLRVAQILEEYGPCNGCQHFRETEELHNLALQDRIQKNIYGI